ncbi:MAG: universal stress protein [Solirubrobacterales bacterium]|nr:universal stress protein [Solirubrobacterales bacterium]
MRGDVALDAIREVPCAVASAPAGYAATAPHQPRRIAVGWDASPEADEALEWAVQLAERTAGEVRILHVGDLPGDGTRLEAVCRAAADRVPATSQRLEGEPQAALSKVEDADLLVLGSRGRSPLRRVLGGSVSADVVHHARCPVVVLPRGVQAPVETTA